MTQPTAGIMPAPPVSPGTQRISNEQELGEAAAKYQNPTILRSAWQLLNSFVPLFTLLYLMHRSLAGSYWITLGLSILAAGFMVRVFIIQHDCGHGSFFFSRKLNERVGYFCSVFTMVPYYFWRRAHALHHASNGNLDRRGIGDMDIFTVEEYLALSKFNRLRYRFYRHPVVFLLFGPLALFFYMNRHCPNAKQYSKRDRRNVHMTNLTVVGMLALIGALIGFRELFLIGGPVLFIASGLGIWLFYIQHQFEHTYWKPEAEWDFTRAAMQGSSFYKLPRLLQWFTGNIGYHHIHHLRPNIPNYELERCYKENPAFHDVYEVSLFASLKSMFLSVWDESEQRLISFRHLKRKYA